MSKSFLSISKFALVIEVTNLVSLVRTMKAYYSLKTLLLPRNEHILHMTWRELRVTRGHMKFLIKDWAQKACPNGREWIDAGEFDFTDYDKPTL